MLRETKRLIYKAKLGLRSAEWEILQLLRFPDTPSVQRNLLVEFIEEKLRHSGRPEGTTKESKLDVHVAGYLASLGRRSIKGPRSIGRDGARLGREQMKALLSLAIQETRSELRLSPAAVQRQMDRKVNSSVKSYVKETMPREYYRMIVLEDVLPSPRYKKTP